MDCKRIYDKVVKQIDSYFLMRCSPPRLLRYKKRFRMIDRDIYIVLGEDNGDFLIYSNEERKDIIASIVLPKHKVPLVFNLVEGFESCLCPSLKFLKSYHIQQGEILNKLIEESDSSSDIES